MDDKEQQTDELSTLTAIFDEDFIALAEVPESGALPYILSITIDKPSPFHADIEPLVLEFGYPADYPSTSPPVFTLSAPWLSDEDKIRLLEELRRQFVPDEVVIFQWADWLRENVTPFLGIQSKFKERKIPLEEEEEEEPIPEEIEVTLMGDDGSSKMEEDQPSEPQPDDLKIFTGTPLTDRKSKFVGHVALVNSEADVDRMVEQLKRNSKKVASATHNIMAYRIQDEDKVKEGRDDDGETGAGDKVLFLLQQRGWINVCVVVTRWYGGIQLGADRFRHITNVAKDTIEQSGLFAPPTPLETTTTQSPSKKGNKKTKK
eukprot:TRINITY_DN15465_c0_g1_i1.p1 TRINITY_DN15465_c0_g1~~TRINITY_DN15465_c0_g1_i1.p1  ORF type:complete len:318 (+),score=100.11 TRINITY_DN15465_c0_g1_i1:211-1164(+)